MRRLPEDPYGAHPDLVIEPTALGAKPGEASMFLSNQSIIATLSAEWLELVSQNGRFENAVWDGQVKVPVVTLDSLIARHGTPAFVKIDVEGFELEVVAGLSQPVRALSFEFIPEQLDRAFACLDRLETIGDWRYQYSLGESMRFGMSDWTTRDEIVRCLKQTPSDLFGDLYASCERCVY